MLTTHWSELSQAEREREYSPSSCIGGDYRPFVRAYQTRSEAARAQVRAEGVGWQLLHYGPKPSNTIELALPPNPRGLLVFIHGGYWQELSAAESLFAAPACIRHGIGFAAIDYTLAPAAGVAVIAAECRAGLKRLLDAVAPLGLGADKVVVAGNSAGAHLAAMVSLTASAEWTPPPLRAAILVSGIFELEPLIGTSINDALRLDRAGARAVSPACLKVAGSTRALVCWGDNETAEFKRQSSDYALRLEAAGLGCQSFEIAGRNHFDVIFDLVDSTTPLGQTTLSLF